MTLGSRSAQPCDPIATARVLIEKNDCNQAAASACQETVGVKCAWGLLQGVGTGSKSRWEKASKGGFNWQRAATPRLLRWAKKRSSLSGTCSLASSRSPHNHARWHQPDLQNQLHGCCTGHLQLAKRAQQGVEGGLRYRILQLLPACPIQ